MTTKTPIDGPKLITKIRTQLLLNHPWFGSLAMRLQPVEDNSQPTAYTDGTTIGYNSEYLSTLTTEEQIGLFAHEVMHCAMRHMYRRNGRDGKKWNYATDAVINNELLAAGFKLPDGGVNEPQYKGMSAEQVYSSLPADPPGGYPGAESPTGEFKDPQPKDEGGNGGDDEQEDDPAGGDEQDQQQQDGNSEQDWELAVEQASMVARKSGKLPGGVETLVKQARSGQDNCWDTLRRFVEQTLPKDYSWSKPNRRFLSQGLYLPSIIKENAPRFAVIADSSGSIYSDPELIQLFADKLSVLMHEIRPVQIDVIYVDTCVRSVETFTPEDPEVTITMRGGGGTLFQPAFDYINAQDDKPACVIYLTDLMCADTPKEPDYPVLWAVPEQFKGDGLFGETIKLTKW